MSAPEIGEHFFRHEYGRLVAMLCRRVGMHHLQAVEDGVQAALLAGLESWRVAGPPHNPSAWLYQVAFNRLSEELRTGARRQQLLEREAESVGAEAVSEPNEAAGDSLLHLLFACCSEAIAVESQLVLALKTVCGFDIAEVAARLFISEATAYKRLQRARSRLQADTGLTLELSPSEFQARLPAVLKVIYLLFTEGYLSLSEEMTIRRELCDEALRLGQMLAQHPLGQAPESSALVALMSLHRARLGGRQDVAGGLLLLEEQDRALWDQQQIATGLHWLARSAEGGTFSRYHAEAGVAAEHCLAPSFEETRWERVAACYELLERYDPSPLHTLNRAVAVAEGRGAQEGLALLEGLAPPGWLLGSYLWAAVQADLHRRAGNQTEAESYRAAALSLAPTPAVVQLLRRRLGG